MLRLVGSSCTFGLFGTYRLAHNGLDTATCHRETCGTSFVSRGGRRANNGARILHTSKMCISHVKAVVGDAHELKLSVVAREGRCEARDVVRVNARGNVA